MAYEISEQKKVGLGLIGFGILFSFLGMILFFDRGLLALGNILGLAGVALLLGWRSTLQLFTNRMNYKGSLSFLLGIFLIFVRWPIVGIIMELYGCLVLFGGFWPSVKIFLYQIPVFGWLLQYPVLNVGKSYGGKRFWIESLIHECLSAAKMSSSMMSKHQFIYAFAWAFFLIVCEGANICFLLIF